MDFTTFALSIARIITLLLVLLTVVTFLLLNIRPIKIVKIINRDYWEIVVSGLGVLFIGSIASAFGLDFNHFNGWGLYLIIWWSLYQLVKNKNE